MSDTASAPAVAPTLSLQDMLDEKRDADAMKEQQREQAEKQPKWSVVVPRLTSGDTDADLGQRPRTSIVQGELLKFYLLLELPIKSSSTHRRQPSGGISSSGHDVPVSSWRDRKGEGRQDPGTASASEHADSVSESTPGLSSYGEGVGTESWFAEYGNHSFDVAILTDDAGTHTSASVVPGHLIGEERSRVQDRQSPSPIPLGRQFGRKGRHYCVFPLEIEVAIAPQYLHTSVRLSVSIYPPRPPRTTPVPGAGNNSNGTMAPAARTFTVLQVRQPLHVTGASAQCGLKTYISVSVLNTKTSQAIRLRDIEFHLRTSICERRPRLNTLSPLAASESNANGSQRGFNGDIAAPIRFEDSFRSFFHSKKMPMELGPGENHTFTVVVDPVARASLAETPAGDFLTLLTLTWTSEDQAQPIRSPYYLRWTRPLRQPLSLSLRYPSSVYAHKVFCVNVTVCNLESQETMEVYLITPADTSFADAIGNTNDAALVAARGDTTAVPGAQQLTLPQSTLKRERSQSWAVPSRSRANIDPSSLRPSESAKAASAAGNGTPGNSSKKTPNKLVSRLQKLRASGKKSSDNDGKSSKKDRKERREKKEKRLSLKNLTSRSRKKGSVEPGTSNSMTNAPSSSSLAMSATSVTDDVPESPSVPTEQLTTPSPAQAMGTPPSQGSPVGIHPGVSRVKRPLNRSLRFSDSYNINPYSDLHDVADICSATDNIAHFKAPGTHQPSPSSPASLDLATHLLARTSSASRIPRSRRTHSDFDISLDSETEDSTASDVSEDGSYTGMDVSHDSDLAAVGGIMSSVGDTDGSAIPLVAVPDVLQGYSKMDRSDTVLCMDKTLFLGKLAPATSISVNLHFVALKEGFTSLGVIQVYDRIHKRYYHLRQEATLCVTA